MSDVSHQRWSLNGVDFVEVRATGGSRRERGSKTGALIRKLPGKWVKYHTSYSETHGFLTATYTKYQCDKPVRFDAHTGRPSWHQAKAEEYVERYKASHPGEPAFVLTKD